MRYFLKVLVIKLHKHLQRLCQRCKKTLNHCFYYEFNLLAIQQILSKKSVITVMWLNLLNYSDNGV